MNLYKTKPCKCYPVINYCPTQYIYVSWKENSKGWPKIGHKEFKVSNAQVH